MRVLSRPDRVQLRLGALRLLVSSTPEEAYRNVVKGHASWWKGTGMKSPPAGAPQASKRVELTRMALNYGLATTVGGPLTQMGQAFRILTTLEPKGNPYLWKRSARFGGVLAVVYANGDMLRLLLADWPEAGLTPGGVAEATRRSVARLAAESGASSGLAKLSDRTKALDDEKVRQQVSYPYLEPLRELGLLASPPMPRGGTSGHFPGYRLTPAGRIFADGLRAAPSADALLRDGIGRLALTIEGIPLGSPADARTVLGLRGRVPAEAWGSETELSVALLAYVAQGALMDASPGTWCDPKSVNEVLRRLEESEPHVVSIHKGGSLTDFPNLVLRPKLATWEAESGDARGEGHTPEAMEIEERGRDDGDDLKPPPVEEAPVLQDEFIPSPPPQPMAASERELAWLSLVSELAEPAAFDSPSLMAVAGPRTAHVELRRILRLPERVQTQYRSHHEHCLSPDAAMIWLGPGRPLRTTGKEHADNRERRWPDPASTLSLHRLMEESPTQLSALAFLLQSWPLMEEPATQMIARVDACGDEVLASVRQMATWLSAWVTSADPFEVGDLDRVRRVTTLLLQDAVESGRVCREDIWGAAEEVLTTGNFGLPGSRVPVDVQGFLKTLLADNKQSFRWSASVGLDPRGASADRDRIAAYLDGALQKQAEWEATQSLRVVVRSTQETERLHWRELEVSGTVDASTERGAARSAYRQIDAFRQALGRSLHERLGPQGEEPVRVEVGIVNVESPPSSENVLSLQFAGPVPVPLARRLWLGDGSHMPAGASASTSLAVRRAEERLASSAGPRYQPADDLLNLWISLEAAVQPVQPVAERTRTQRLSAAAVLDFLPRRIARAARHILADALQEWFRSDTNGAFVGTAILARLQPEEWQKISERRAVFAPPIRQAAAMDGILAAFLPRSRHNAELVLLCDILAHRGDWVPLVGDSRPVRTASRLDVAEWLRVTETQRGFAVYLRGIWLEAVAFVERMYRLRNRIVHEGAGLDGGDEPVFGEIAFRAKALYQPLLWRLGRSAAADARAEELWELAVLLLREATHSIVQPTHGAKEREAAYSTPVESGQLLRWFGWPDGA